MRGALDLLVLSVLHDEFLPPEEIAAVIERASEEALNVSPGHLYQALQRLLENGCIRKRDSHSGSCVAYQCTAKGRKFLRVEQTAWARLSEAVTQVVKWSSGSPASAKRATCVGALLSSDPESGI